MALKVEADGPLRKMVVEANADGQVHGEVFHIGAAALLGAHQPALHQCGQRAADGVAVHAEALGQRVLGRQALTRRVHALANRLRQLVGDVRPEVLAG